MWSRGWYLYHLPHLQHFMWLVFFDIWQNLEYGRKLKICYLFFNSTKSWKWDILWPGPELIEDLPCVELIVGGTSSWRPPVVTLWWRWCWWRCWLCWVVRLWIWRWRWFWWWWHCSGDSRYKPRHHHERNCDVTKKVLRTIFNSRHATEKLPRRLLGQPGFWRPPFEIICLLSEKSNTLKTFLYNTHLALFLAAKRCCAEDFKDNPRPLGAREEVRDVFAAEKPSCEKVVGQTRTNCFCES